MNVYRRLKTLLNGKQKRDFILLLVLIIISAFLETLGVSVILPIITAVADPDAVLGNEYVRTVMNMMGLELTGLSFAKLVLIAAIIIYAVKNLYLLFLYYIQAAYVSKLESGTSSRLLNDYLNRPYEFYLNADVNAIFQTVNKDIPHVFILLQEVLLTLTEMAVVVCLCIVLFIVNIKMTLISSLFIGVLLLIVVFAAKPKLGRLGTQRLEKQVSTMKWMQQAVFGIKDVKAADRKDYFLRCFADSYDDLANANRKYTVLSALPRLLLEFCCMAGALGFLLVCVLNGVDMMPMLPTIGVFAASAIRLLQSVNRISTHLSSIAYYETSLNFVCDNIDVTGLKGIDRNESRSKERISIKKGVEVKDITYRYPSTEKKIFDHASMSIPVGKSIGVVGVSGAGKTTVIDILLGLLKPEEGSVYADGRDIHDDLPAYLHDTGYIAQNIYMLDATIRENVAFGEKREDISDERVWEALREAQLEDFVKSLPDGLDTQTGDRGVRISGGQRQRIGIARALYNDPELLIFDEATSALDNDTEAAIMEAINALKGRKTMVIIAHRLGTIENCDIIYRVENGKIETTKI